MNWTQERHQKIKNLIARLDDSGSSSPGSSRGWEFENRFDKDTFKGSMIWGGDGDGIFYVKDGILYIEEDVGEFIALARQDLPDALEEIERLNRLLLLQSLQ